MRIQGIHKFPIVLKLTPQTIYFKTTGYLEALPVYINQGPLLKPVVDKILCRLSTVINYGLHSLTNLNTD